MFGYRLYSSSLTKIVIILACSTFSCKGASLNEACDDNNVCTVSGSSCVKANGCSKGWCSCSDAGVKYYNKTYCITVQRLGQPCPLGYAQCGSNAACLNGVCNCSTSNRPSDDGYACLRGSIPLGGNCSALTSGCGVFAQCAADTKLCTCYLGVTPATNGYDCRYLALDEDCTNSGLCDSSQNLKCDATTKKCSCPDGSTFKNIYVSGVKKNYCLPSNAIQGLSFGGACYEPTGQGCGTGNNFRICGEGLSCTECPELYGSCIRQCTGSNGHSMKYSSSSGFLAALITILHVLIVGSGETMR